MIASSHQSFVNFAIFGFILNAINLTFLISNILKLVLNYGFVLNASVNCFFLVHLIIKFSVHLF